MEDIAERAVPGGKRAYYTLRPVYQENNVIYAPADSDKIFMRPLISRKDAEELIKSVPEVRKEALSNPEIPETQEFHSCRELLSVAVRIYEKRKEARRLKRKLGFTYEKQLHIAEQLLFGELATVLDIEPESVPQLLFAAINE